MGLGEGLYYSGRYDMAQLKIKGTRLERLQVNINYSEDKSWLGGSIYLDNLLKTLASLPIDERPVIKVNRAAPLLPQTPTCSGDNDLAGDAKPGLIKRIYRRLPLPEGIRGRVRRIKRTEVKEKSVNLPHINFPVVWAAPDDPAAVYWIPDFQHVHLPEFFQPSEIESRNKIHREVSQCNGILVLSSQTAMNDFNSLYPNARVRPRRWSFCSHLTIEAGNPVFDIRSSYDLPEKYLYVPNQFWAHKDHITVFQALKILHDQGMRLDIVCTGYQADSRNPLYFQNIMEYVTDNGLGSQVRVLGVVPREHQLEVFRHAAAVVQPSLFEGWSTVIEDAKAVGRPIVASDFPVHLEQLEGMDRVWFFKRSASKELAGLLRAIWPELRPGPDLEAEAKAVENTEVRRLHSGREFMRIVTEAADLAYNV